MSKQIAIFAFYVLLLFETKLVIRLNITNPSRINSHL